MKQFINHNWTFEWSLLLYMDMKSGHSLQMLKKIRSDNNVVQGKMAKPAGQKGKQTKHL